jgi:hypothetical protein
VGSISRWVVLPSGMAMVTVTVSRPFTAASGGSPETTDRAWIARQLDAAVKGRLTVTVTIAMPDGSTTHLEMEPTGIGGGRVRGRDKKSDVERTLPLSHVVAVSSAT